MARFVPGFLIPHEMFRRRASAAQAAETTTRPPQLPPPPPPERREASLDLELIGVLGEGFFARVYKVRNRRTGDVFALKQAFEVSMYAGEGEEVEVLRRVAAGPPSPPFVVRCHAVFLERNGALGSVLEFMDAGSLLSILRRRGRRGFPEPALAEVASRCLLGLSYIHSRGVAHLDVKPDNVLANSRGEVKINDFNTSCVVFGRVAKTLAVPTVTGATAFLRFDPDSDCDDPYAAMAADVWGLGHTILELFLGRLPDSSDETSPPSVPENVVASAELRGFLDACLQKDPARCATVPQLLKHPFLRRRNVVVSFHALRQLIRETL